jgi:hypothetical protein
MELAHETALNDLVRVVYDIGVATIEVRLLLRWHDQKNLSKAIWRDLQQRFERVLHERGNWGQGYQLLAMSKDAVVALLCVGPNIGQGVPSWLLVTELATFGRRAGLDHSP